MTFWRSITSRRQMFRGAGQGLLAGGLLPAWMGTASAAPTTGGNLYERIGVKPLVNCKGTYTILSGSLTLPEVKQAMDEASRHYVHMDELMEGVSRRLAELTKAEWGIVTAGCAAALTHSTSACLAGADPEKMQRLPNLRGMKTEVVMPKESRNVYDQAIRMLGVTMLTPETADDFRRMIQRPQVAMLSLLGETAQKHPVPLEEMVRLAHAHNVPVLVDAAAERLTIPNFYLTKGVDLVAYSGGKCIRGPQSAGLLLGRRDLVHAAWLNSAPHHAFGRSLKIDKEVTMGMLAAVEAWVRRDHDAEWKQWESWLETIRAAVTKVPGVETKTLLPPGPSNYSPRLQISFDPQRLGATGFEISDALMNGTPRVMVPPGENSLTVMPYMMQPGDDKVAAKAIAGVLSNPPRRPAAPRGEDAPVAGQWDVEVTFTRGSGHHRLFLEQKGKQLAGTHVADTLSGEVRGTIENGRVQLRSGHRYEGTRIGYRFDGVVTGGALRGKIDLGEYGSADFIAKRSFA